MLALGLLLAVGAVMIAQRRATPVTPAGPVVVPTPTAKVTPHEPRRPRLPAPRLPQTAGPADSVPEAAAPNPLAKLLNGEGVKLTPEQVDAYLQQNKRSAEALLAAARMTGNLGLAREAAEKSPHDPRVQLDLALRGETPEEKRKALDRFRQLARDNPLGDYLSALDHFKSGRTDDGVKDLLQVGGKHRFQDYTHDHAQNAEEALLSAGHGVLESKAAGLFGVVLPHLQLLRELGTQMTELQKQYAQAGDSTSAQAVGQMGLNLAWQMEGQPGRTLVGELVGLSIEKKFLTAQSPDSPFGTDGRTVRDRLAELDAHRQSMRELTPFTDMLPRLSEREALIYFDRLKLHGEADALRWLKNKHGNP
ncbi:MAG: hypothetical protein B9S33_07270 [Pedosphaera sp. Tous-C6FEB]|nr:MAG: hypothetical protein B9S33_07270 [Pedosphaera sp. Tous-C6FEB]